MNIYRRDYRIVPLKVSSTSAESAGTRLIDTGGGFLIEESASGKQSSLTSRVIYDPGCSFFLFEYFVTLKASMKSLSLCIVLSLAFRHCHFTFEQHGVWTFY